MRKEILILLLLILAAACSATPTPVVVVPTLAVLPSVLPTETPSPTWTPSEVPPSAPPPTATDTPLPTMTVTYTPSATGTNTPTATGTFTYTPSLTITNTITPTPSPTFTASPELDSLGMLALLSQRATILPPEKLYNPADADGSRLRRANADRGGGLRARRRLRCSARPLLARRLLPRCRPVVCTIPPPGGLGGAFAADPSLAQAIGCPVGTVFTTTTAVQSFEHGTMIYVQGSPGSIYVLTLDGRFRRFDDTWLSPASIPKRAAKRRRSA